MQGSFGIRIRAHFQLFLITLFLSFPTTRAWAYTAIDLPAFGSLGNNWSLNVSFVGLNGVAVGTAYQIATTNPPNPALWIGSDPPILLFPFGSQAHVNTGTATEQVGYFQNHAVLWHSSSDSFVDIHPTLLPVISSQATGTGGGQQVGFAMTQGTPHEHAVLWSGTATSAVDLHPAFPSLGESYAVATDGSQQVGSLNNSAFAATYAVVWSGTAASAVNLHPTQLASITGSAAYGVGGGQQVGVASFEKSNISTTHAFLWSGSAASAVDLHPILLFPDSPSSSAVATNGSVQVGNVATSTGSHAIAWFGTADSAIDLQSLLPTGFNSSSATAIDSAGNIFGTAYDSTGNFHAIEWAVPEPSSLGIFGLLTVGLLRRLRRR